jgi:glycosyltransferase involved in cell wall biosynthesis
VPERPPAARTSGPRILLVSPGVYPPDFGGGQLRVHKTLVRLRERLPLDVRVLAVTGASPQPFESLVDGVPVTRFPAGMSAVALAVAVGRRLLRARRDGVQLVYTLSVSRVVYIAAAWARLLGLPLVVEFMNRNLDANPMRRRIVRLLVRSARQIIAISQPMGEDLRALGAPPERLWVRPNPVDLGLCGVPTAQQRSELRQEFGCAGDGPLHLVAGTLSSRKNQIFAVTAFERLAGDHRLLIVGPVLPQNEAFAQSLRERIAQSPARDRIRLLDRFVSDMPRYMQAADCLWLASLEEGLGNVMLEALCCGVPCLVNAGLGLGEHVQDGLNGRHAALDLDAWAAAATALLPLMADLPRRAAIGAEARGRYDASAFDRTFYDRMVALADGSDG